MIKLVFRDAKRGLFRLFIRTFTRFDFANRFAYIICVKCGIFADRRAAIKQ